VIVARQLFAGEGAKISGVTQDHPFIKPGHIVPKDLLPPAASSGAAFRIESDPGSPDWRPAQSAAPALLRTHSFSPVQRKTAPPKTGGPFELAQLNPG